MFVRSVITRVPISYPSQPRQEVLDRFVERRRKPRCAITNHSPLELVSIRTARWFISKSRPAQRCTQTSRNGAAFQWPVAVYRCIMQKHTDSETTNNNVTGDDDDDDNRLGLISIVWVYSSLGLRKHYLQAFWYRNRRITALHDMSGHKWGATESDHHQNPGAIETNSHSIVG